MWIKRFILIFLTVVSINFANDVNLDNFKVSKLQFAKKIGYPMYPSCLFFNKNGELVYDEVGYRDEKKFLETLKTVSSKAYNDIE